MLFYILVVLIIIAIILIVVLSVTKTDDNTTTQVSLNRKLFQNCSTNFECDNGYHCELRDHPSKGICVIAPGGACHRVQGSASEKSVSCYSGYYCDTKEGICLKK